MENEELLKQLAESQSRLATVLEKMGGDAHEKAPATTNTAGRLHGLTGLFSSSALERDIISTHVRPYGLGAILPLMPSVNEDPRFGSITGISAPVGNQPAHACDDAPTSYLKGCNLRARFGLKRFDTATIEFDTVMRKISRGDWMDLQLRGRLLGMDNLGPRNMPSEGDVLNVMTAAEMVMVGAQFERALNTDLWQGTVAAGSFPGLDAQIATGQRDADTNALCPSLDSDIKAFAYNDVCGNSPDIVEYMSAMEFYLTSLAEQTGVGPVKWVWAMRPQLFFELSGCWPCKYLTNRCKTANVGYNALVVNDEANVSMRDDMRNRKKITVNGTEYDVVTDTGIFEHNNINDANLAAGQFASDIYFIPLTIQGAFPVTYREYLDYRDPIAAANVALLRNKEQFWTDDGIYSWALEQIKWCYKLAAKTEQRVVLRTPWLAGRISHVRYSPLQHLRDPEPTSGYWIDGGVSMRSQSEGYAVWYSR